MTSPVPRLHAVTDIATAQSPQLARVAAQLAASGTIAFHARLPAADGARVIDLVSTFQAIRRGAITIVNDRLDVALIEEADGLHLPEQGLPLAIARRLLSNDQLLGCSTHGPDQAKRMLDEGADYSFLGPIWPTPSHPGVAPLGPGVLEQVAGMPVIAIGGVTPERARLCREAGAWGVAAISALWQAHDPGAAAKAMLLSFDQ